MTSSLPCMNEWHISFRCSFGVQPSPATSHCLETSFGEVERSKFNKNLILQMVAGSRINVKLVR